MFGFGKHKRLAQSIEAFMETWTAVQAMDAVLSGNEGPPVHRPAHLGILWGVTDSLAQLQGLNMETTAKGLKHYLARFSDGPSMFPLVVAAPRHPDLLPWVNLAGEAVHQIAAGKDPMHVLRPMVNLYRSNGKP